MNNEEKMLEILAQLQETQKQMLTEQELIRESLKQVQTEQMQMREEQKQMREDIQQVKDRLDRVEDRATRTAAIQENVIQRSIAAIAEGQDMTHQMMKELASKREVEDLRDQVEILRTVVALHSREIEALKKAQ